MDTFSGPGSLEISFVCFLISEERTEYCSPDILIILYYTQCVWLYGEVLLLGGYPLLLYNLESVNHKKCVYLPLPALWLLPLIT